MSMLVAGLLLGLSAAGENHPRVALDHRGKTVTATYRPQVSVARRQIGSTVPGGRPSTLRCTTTASIAVERHARRADGLAVSRRLAAAPLSATRPGWCAGTPIAADRLDAHVRRAVAEAVAADRATVLAELDAAHDRAAG